MKGVKKVEKTISWGSFSRSVLNRSRQDAKTAKNSKSKKCSYSTSFLIFTAVLYRVQGAYSPEVEGVQRTPCHITSTRVNYF